MTQSISHEEIQIRKALGSEKIARKRAGSIAAQIGFDPERIEDIKTAVGEATLNAIEHSSRLDPSGTVLVQIDSDRRAMQIAVSSKGRPYVLSDAKPDIAAKIDGRDRPRGWGLFLIRALSDEVEFNDNHDVTTVRMKFLLKPDQSS